VDVALSAERVDPTGAAPPSTTADYKLALDYLFARTTGGFKFGLERTVQLLEHLGNPHRAYRAIHVAGTNGKGSSVATMATLMTANGRRVATYTSPHLVDFRERMIVGGEPIPPHDVVDFIERHMPVIEEIGASFFEATTAMAFDFFARAGAEIAVIEAGLGGRLDSTNVLQPLVAGVTSIGLDHTEYLGSTLEEIAGEKAGIFKAGAVAVIGEREPRIRELLAEHARRNDASSIRIVANEVELDRVSVDDAGTQCEFRWKGARQAVRTPLAGEHQAANLAFSLVTLDAAGELAPLDAVARQLHDVRIPGRFQRVGHFIFDVAHNPAGADVLVETLSAVAPTPPVTVVLCVLRDKDWREMMRILSRAASRFVLTMAPTAPASRAWDLGEAAAFAAELGIDARVVSDFGDAVRGAGAMGGTVLVTGSFHTVGDAMSLLQVSPFAG
jgi:dihydrofolate synthase/folylpolyglutamate synthase